MEVSLNAYLGLIVGVFLPQNIHGLDEETH